MRPCKDSCYSENFFFFFQFNESCRRRNWRETPNRLVLAAKKTRITVIRKSITLINCVITRFGRLRNEEKNVLRVNHSTIFLVVIFLSFRGKNISNWIVLSITTTWECLIWVGHGDLHLKMLMKISARCAVRLRCSPWRSSLVSLS